MYDVAVIGAGINGCSVAYQFTQAGKKVVVFDMNGIAGGGSGAAGAFISPKFSKAGPLKELLDDAFIYSTHFYEKNFPNETLKTQLIHIPKDEKDKEILDFYKTNTNLPLLDISQLQIDILNNINLKNAISLYSNIIQPKQICKNLCKNSNLIKEKVTSLDFHQNYWIINNTTKAKIVILATGAYQKIIDEPYIQLRGIWGHRIDIKTTTTNNYSFHQYVSISPSKNNNIISIGATHNVHYHPENTKEPYNYEEGRAELLQKAAKTVKLKDIEIIKDYTGLRSGSFDYIPMVGKLVNSKATLQKNIIFKTKKPNYEEYIYHKNLYIINGSGGYGFVFAPYLANILSKYILEKKEIDNRLNPARFFARWAKKI